MHFETITGNKGDRFIDICSKNTNRVSLEFGVQTIHQKEMEELCRDNDISHIEKIMGCLKKNNIKYSVSIIYGIPYQTVDSFRKTIDFIKKRL
jgi:radical SAM superfamily enzyme